MKDTEFSSPSSRSLSPRLKLNSIPSKPFFVITLTTPAIASDPYTDEAPSARISIRSTAIVGIILILTAPDPPR